MAIIDVCNHLMLVCINLSVCSSNTYSEEALHPIQMVSGRVFSNGCGIFNHICMVLSLFRSVSVEGYILFIFFLV